VRGVPPARFRVRGRIQFQNAPDMRLSQSDGYQVSKSLSLSNPPNRSHFFYREINIKMDNSREPLTRTCLYNRRRSFMRILYPLSPPPLSALSIYQ